MITAEDFFNEEYGLIFRAIVDLYEHGTPPNMPSISDWLQRKGYIFKVEGSTISPYDKVRMDSIMAMRQVAFTTAYAETFTLKIKEASNRLKLIKLGNALQTDAANVKNEMSALITSSEKAFRDITNESASIKYIECQNYFAKFFDEDTNALRFYSKRKTGFSNIDANQIFTLGLYVIGATPAAGKTTCCWKLLDQLAKNEKTCFFCSYEMSALEFYAQSIAREIFIREKTTALSSVDIRCGSSSDTLIEVMVDFIEDEQGGVKLLELREESIDDLIRLLRHFCTDKGKSPLVCLDCLQIVPPSKDQRLINDKARIDDIVHKLKNFQRETHTTFIPVSSFKRLNYYPQVSFESFKESGNI